MAQQEMRFTTLQLYSVFYNTVFLQCSFSQEYVLQRCVYSICSENLSPLLQTAPLQGVVLLPEDVGSQRFFPLPAASEYTCTVRC